jgi:hypothetical protein
MARDHVTAIVERATSFTGNPYIMLRDFEQLTVDEFVLLTPREQDNFLFVLAKLARRQHDVADRARALQHVFGVWNTATPVLPMQLAPARQNLEVLPS